MSGRKKSILWTHFNTTEGSVLATCNICKNKISFKGGSTANLHRHIKTRHPGARLNEVRREEEEEAEAQSAAPSDHRKPQTPGAEARLRNPG